MGEIIKTSKQEHKVIDAISKAGNSVRLEDYVGFWELKLFLQPVCEFIKKIGAY